MAQQWNGLVTSKNLERLVYPLVWPPIRPIASESGPSAVPNVVPEKIFECGRPEANEVLIRAPRVSIMWSLKWLECTAVPTA